MLSHWSIETIMEGGALQSTVTLARCGEAIILFDTGYQRMEIQLRAELALRGLTENSVTHVVNTHLHFDHSHNNVIFQKAQIFCSRLEFAWMTELSRRIVHAGATLEEIFQFYPELRRYEEAPKPIWTMVRMVRRFWAAERLGRDDQLLWLEDYPLPEGIRVLATPGHVPHHHSFVVDTAGGAVLVAGDAVISRDPEGDDLQTFPPVERAGYDETKRMLLAFKGTIIPGHGGPFYGAP